MTTLHRITTRYDAVEDRIGLTGEVTSGETLVIWLTRPLLNQLVTHLVQWVEKQQPDMLRADMLLSFAQEAAQNAQIVQPPVVAQQQSRHWMARDINISPQPGQICLTFRGGADEQAVLFLAATPLRQWLGILHRGYRSAGWPLQAWPTWILEAATPPNPVAVVLN